MSPGVSASPSPATTTAATESPEPANTPPSVASPSPAASGVKGSEFCPTGGVAASGDDISTTEPDVSVRLPDGWDGMAMAEYAQLLEATMTEVDDPRITQAFEAQLAEIEDGILRAAGTGVSEPSGFSAVLILSVRPKAGDFESTIDLRLQEQTSRGIPGTVVALDPTQVPLGAGYCTAVLSDIDIGTPSQTIEYLVELDGEIVGIGGTAPVTDTAFAALVRSVALSLAAG